MSALILRVRELVFDPNNGSAVWTQQQIQDALDLQSEALILESLEPTRTIVSGGVTSYLTWTSDYRYWEDDVLIQDYNYATYDPLTYSADLFLGIWTFTTHQRGPIWITGTVYDIYSAAADI